MITRQMRTACDWNEPHYPPHAIIKLMDVTNTNSAVSVSVSVRKEHGKGVKISWPTNDTISHVLTDQNGILTWYDSKTRDLSPRKAKPLNHIDIQ